MGNTRSLPPSPPADTALPTLISECDTLAASLLSQVPVSDVLARYDSSLAQAIAQRNACRFALLSVKARALFRAKLLSIKQSKCIAADLEAADVSSEQLRVWAAVLFEIACPDGFVVDPSLTHAIEAVTPLATHSLIVRTVSFCVRFTSAAQLPALLGRVAPCGGLRVVSGSGRGLTRFKPHNNVLRVVLAEDDGSVPAWLIAGDVALTVLPAVGAVGGSDTGTIGTSLCVDSNASLGALSFAYGNVAEGVHEVRLQLTVCGAAVADAAGLHSWYVRVLRAPVTDHACAALGKSVRTLAVAKQAGWGIAVRADEKWMATVLINEGTISVYSLPGGTLVRTFGGRGNGQLQFNGLGRLCFAPNGNLIVVDCDNKRLQEVTLEGVFVRFIGVGEFGVDSPFCVAAHDEVIAVGCEWGTGPRVVLFDFETGAVTSRFGEVGITPGQLSIRCSGIHITSDDHVIVAENCAKRLSIFTAAGVFVRCVGVGVLGEGILDLVRASTGEHVVADCGNDRVCVFSSDGSELVRSWAAGQLLDHPVALAAAGKHLYVKENFFYGAIMKSRVRVYL